MRKKIGIITFHNAHNYGAMLQAYSLLKKIKELKEYDVEILNYYNKRIYSSYKIIRPFRKNPIKFFKQFMSDVLNLRKNTKRYKAFDTFIKNNCKLSKLYYSDSDVFSINNEYDILITGSDQVWNPRIVGELSDIYTLKFGGDSVKRISYAASIGNKDVIIENSDLFAEKLSRLDYISVREDDAKAELEKILTKSVETVLDPTLLISKDEWENRIEEFNKLENKYIVAYVVEPDEEYIKIVNDLSLKTGLPVLHFGKRNPGYNNVIKTAYTEGPLEFVNYIKNADYIVATSFHATVFSIIFNKKFFIVPHRKTGARVTNLLELLGIDGRVFYNYDEFREIDYNFETNWNVVNKKLEVEREKSIKWLKNAIEG